nr:hypothetical protein [Tanacetum cinerariifolium]
WCLGIFLARSKIRLTFDLLSLTDVPLGGEVDEPMVDPEFDEMDDNVDDDDMDNLEYRHGVLTRNMEEFSDVKVADSITIGEIHPEWLL